MPQTDSAIIFKNVAKRFGKVEVHRNISFHIDTGEVVTILGPSGTGKTVILKMMIGLLTPTRGEISVFDQRIDNLDEDALHTVRQEIGMLFQGAALFDSLTIFDNIAYGLRERGEVHEDQIADIVHEKLKIVNLAGIGNKTPPELSGGQKKRVGLARALASSPKIVLFDEPTTGLDPTSVRLIDDLIIRLKEDYGITSVVVTHDIGSAKRISDRWIMISEGNIIAEGSVDKLLAESEQVEQFVNGKWYEA